MTFDPQALYDALRPVADGLEREGEELRRQPASDRVEQDVVHALHTAIFHTTNLGFLLARIRREQER